MYGDCAEVGQACFGADGSEFRIHDRNSIITVWILVVESFKFIDWIHVILLLLSDPKYIYAFAAEIGHEDDHAGSTLLMYDFLMYQTQVT